MLVVRLHMSAFNAEPHLFNFLRSNITIYYYHKKAQVLKSKTTKDVCMFPFWEFWDLEIQETCT